MLAPRVAEVDRMSGSLDDREHDSVGGATGDLLHSAGLGISGSRSPRTARVGTLRASNRSNDGYWVAHGTSSRCWARRTSDNPVGPPLSSDSARGGHRGQSAGTRRNGLVGYTTSRRDEDRPLETIWIEVRELADDGATHRVADQRYRLTWRSSRNAAAACAISGTSSGSEGLPLRPNPGRSGTSVWKSSRSRSAVGRR